MVAARTGPTDGGGARRRAADRDVGDAEVRGDPDTWGSPAREREEGRGSHGLGRLLGREGEGEEIFSFFYFNNLFV